MLNNTTVQGRCVADIETKTVGDNISVAEFTVAWSEKYKDTEHKLFLRCKAWRGTAEFASKYFSKGAELIVEGKLGTEEWKDKESGKNQSKTILNVEKIHFCGKKSETGQVATGNTPSGFIPIEDDDIPF